jgi:1,4-dihydroxy-2-naphthoate octaprenyltransferase
MAKPSPALALWLASRPKTLVAGVSPVVLGTTLAWSDGARAPFAAACALVVAAAVQVGTNFFNDWADGIRGTDGPERLGPARATASGWLSPKAVLIASAVAFAIASAAGLALAADRGWWLVGVGAACILSGLAYTGGPFPLAYVGLGEPFVFVFFGLVATAGTYFVQVGSLPQHVLPPAAALGLAATAILVINNLRDREGDARASKKTLAVRFGDRFARRELVVCVAGALACVVVGAWVAGKSTWLLGLLATPLAVLEVGKAAAARGAELNQRLAGAARFEAALSLFLCLGIGLGVER